MKFKKKPVIVEATRWFKNGDHPDDNCKSTKNGLTEGEVVRYFRRPGFSDEMRCSYCWSPMHTHGWIDTLEGGHIVCPGDWIITHKNGDISSCKPDIFNATYEKVEE